MRAARPVAALSTARQHCRSIAGIGWGEVEQRKSRTTASNNLNTLTGPQLTMHGIGFSASNGEHHNPFYHGGYLDYISISPYTDGAGAEPAIHFIATVVQ